MIASTPIIAYRYAYHLNYVCGLAAINMLWFDGSHSEVPAGAL